MWKSICVVLLCLVVVSTNEFLHFDLISDLSVDWNSVTLCLSLHCTAATRLRQSRFLWFYSYDVSVSMGLAWNIAGHSDRSVFETALFCDKPATIRNKLSRFIFGWIKRKSGWTFLNIPDHSRENIILFQTCYSLRPLNCPLNLVDGIFLALLRDRPNNASESRKNTQVRRRLVLNQSDITKHSRQDRNVWAYQYIW